MNTFKNSIIALLTGLLVLTLSTQNSQGATKTYDAVKLVEYQVCIDHAATEWLSGYNPTDERAWLGVCYSLKP